MKEFVGSKARGYCCLRHASSAPPRRSRSTLALARLARLDTMAARAAHGLRPQYPRALLGRNLGFTLIEVLAALAIIGILAGMSVGVYLAFRPQNAVQADAERIESTLRLARTKTLSSLDASAFGVHMQIDQAVLFEGSAYDASDPNNKAVALASQNELFSIVLAGGGSDVVFEKLTGTTQNSGTVSLRAKSDHAQSTTIYIQSIGAVSLTLPPAVVAPGYVRDARHVHFDLGWSMQNAQTLQFYFTSNGQLQSVAMAGFFNADKSSFDTTQSFFVNGKLQIFRVHTHSLTAVGTILSIHRDRNGNQNNEAVDISIIDGGTTKAIASYIADASDTVNGGLYGGTMTIQ